MSKRANASSELARGNIDVDYALRGKLSIESILREESTLKITHSIVSGKDGGISCVAQ